MLSSPLFSWRQVLALVLLGIALGLLLNTLTGTKLKRRPPPTVVFVSDLEYTGSALTKEKLAHRKIESSGVLVEGMK